MCYLWIVQCNDGRMEKGINVMCRGWGRECYVMYEEKERSGTCVTTIIVRVKEEGEGPFNCVVDRVEVKMTVGFLLWLKISVHLVGIALSFPLLLLPHLLPPFLLLLPCTYLLPFFSSYLTYLLPFYSFYPTYLIPFYSSYPHLFYPIPSYSIDSFFHSSYLVQSPSSPSPILPSSSYVVLSPLSSHCLRPILIPPFTLVATFQMGEREKRVGL